MAASLGTSFLHFRSVPNTNSIALDIGPMRATFVAAILRSFSFSSSILSTDTLLAAEQILSTARTVILCTYMLELFRQLFSSLGPRQSVLHL